ncbi:MULTISPECIES: Panacea domain-containing protein [unclassified Deinococcus]|uniref:Panacea domain-containing protein n=1 Tax=unclassified Deinococcus TaxID=2623546 RepID=UPI001C2FB74A|nr:MULTISPECIES: type II toxin-antitoxin system antitoxin SocA domain-containing protein [unclassified Deinococcus]MDK2014598.1 DUF4065 domain-containing protein [Deinococcus sp. 43]
MSAQAVADYFITKPDVEAGDNITHLKIQKLLYYSQGWHLALFNEALFDERIEAWAHGPVVPVVYERLKEFGANPIPLDAVSEEESLTLEQKDLLDEIWEVYGGYTAKALEELTHAESPWLDKRKDLAPLQRCTEEITQQAIKAYFDTLK